MAISKTWSVVEYHCLWSSHTCTNATKSPDKALHFSFFAVARSNRSSVCRSLMTIVKLDHGRDCAKWGKLVMVMVTVGTLTSSIEMDATTPAKAWRWETNWRWALLFVPHQGIRNNICESWPLPIPKVMTQKLVGWLVINDANVMIIWS